jgi:hypothetical protein
MLQDSGFAEEVAMYEWAVISFIDILGFRSLVESSPPEMVSAALGSLEAFTGVGKTSEHDHLLRVFSFSDSIIRIRAIRPYAAKSHPIGLRFYEILDLLHAQALLIDSGHLIRGGVTLGKISMSPNRIFGPGFIEAYDIESKFARYPRIVVSQKALKTLEDTDKPLSECDDRSYDKKHVRELLRQADDGFWFIDYLTGIATELQPPEAYVEFLVKHRKVITSAKLPENELKREVVKYKWLAHYHNRCIEGLREEWCSEHGVNREDFTIDPNELPAWYSF